MLDTTLLLSFLAAVLVFLVSPGPTTTLLCSTGVSHGFSAAFFTGLGISSALLVSILVTVGGLSTLLLEAPDALMVIRFFGIGYFVFLAFKTWKGAKGSSSRSPSPSFSSCFSQGFLVDALNPSGLLFLISFLPQFVNPALGSIKMQLFLLGLIYTLCDASFNIIVAYLCGKVKTSVTTQSRFSRLTALVLRPHASVGIYLALALYFVAQTR
jgi:threonine/homoserine/homoserine lactone efflux protein